MNREDRAKQFAPFEALSGLREALRQKEVKHESEVKREISEEKINLIAETLSTIDKGDKIEVKCFEDGYYITIIGNVTKIDFIKKFLILEEGKILFSNIYEIKRRENL